VPARQDGRSFEDVLGPADELDLEVPLQRLTEIVEPVARAGHEDPDALPDERGGLGAHWSLLS
jgi:hypothetical protein